MRRRMVNSMNLYTRIPYRLELGDPTVSIVARLVPPYPLYIGRYCEAFLNMAASSDALITRTPDEKYRDGFL